MPVSVQIVATPETSASSLFGLYDTLVAAGRDWEHLVSGAEPELTLKGFDAEVASGSRQTKHFRRQMTRILLLCLD